MTYKIEGLVQAIHSGECIAFVGAGFSAAGGLPTWRKLLENVAAEAQMDSDASEHVRQLLDRGSAHAFDEAAQFLEDQLGTERFKNAVVATLAVPPSPSESMTNRIRWLSGIPFRAVLTTNYDSYLPGRLPEPKAFGELLRPEFHGDWRRLAVGPNDRSRRSVLKIHGDVGKPASIVVTRQDYRQLLHTKPGYQSFLRAVLASHPIVYFGFSFTDAYLTELRSELLALVGYQGGAPLAYAVANDVSPRTVEHFRKHEGIQIVSYSTGGDRGHAGFDDVLKAIYENTSASHHFGRLIDGKRILWLDPHPENNSHIAGYLDLAKESLGELASTHAIVPVIDVESALRALRAGQVSDAFDLVITHWGSNQGLSNAEKLLTAMRREDLRCPVIVFAAPDIKNERKPRALQLGAQGYHHTNEGLLRAMERVLSPTND